MAEKNKNQYLVVFPVNLLLLFFGEKLLGFQPRQAIILRHKSHFTASISIKLTDPNLYNLFYKYQDSFSFHSFIFFVVKFYPLG